MNRMRLWLATAAAAAITLVAGVTGPASAGPGAPRHSTLDVRVSASTGCPSP